MAMESCEMTVVDHDYGYDRYCWDYSMIVIQLANDTHYFLKSNLIADLTKLFDK